MMGRLNEYDEEDQAMIQGRRPGKLQPCTHTAGCVLLHSHRPDQCKVMKNVKKRSPDDAGFAELANELLHGERLILPTPTKRDVLLFMATELERSIQEKKDVILAARDSGDTTLELNITFDLHTLVSLLEW